MSRFYLAVLNSCLFIDWARVLHAIIAVSVLLAKLTCNCGTEVTRWGGKQFLSSQTFFKNIFKTGASHQRAEGFT